MTLAAGQPADAAARRAALLDAAYAMLPAIRAQAAAVDEARRLPDALVEELRAAGFMHILQGAECGGAGADPLTAVQVMETLATASPSVAWVTMIIASTTYWTTRVLPDAVAPEVYPGWRRVNLAGTLPPHGRAVKADGGWRLSGQWPFGSGCQHAEWLASGSWLYDAAGPIMENGAPAWRMFLTPANQCAILDTWHTTGLRGTGSHDYTIDDAFVPDRLVYRHSLLEPAVRPQPGYAYPALAVPLLAAVPLGAAQASVDGLIELLGRKIDRRSQRPVAAAPDKQTDLAAAEALVGSARAYLHQQVAVVWRLVEAGETPPIELRGRLRIACTHAVQSAVEAVNLVRRAAGTDAIYTTSELERLFRDVHTAAAHAFVRPATLADGGQLLLGQEPAMRTF